MSKKVLVLSTGFRKNGNSDRMAQEFAKGAVEAGHEVEQVYLFDNNAHCEAMWARMKEELLYGRYDTKKMTIWMGGYRNDNNGVFRINL